MKKLRWGKCLLNNLCTLNIWFDSNVYLSALLFGGNPRQVVEMALLGAHQVVMAEEIYTEMRKVVTIKFPNFLTEYPAL